MLQLAKIFFLCAFAGLAATAVLSSHLARQARGADAGSGPAQLRNRGVGPILPQRPLGCPTGEHDDCLGSRCCQAGLTCYERDGNFARCLRGCAAHAVGGGSPETAWSCRVRGGGPLDGAAPAGAQASDPPRPRRPPRGTGPPGPAGTQSSFVSPSSGAKLYDKAVVLRWPDTDGNYKRFTSQARKAGIRSAPVDAINHTELSVAELERAGEITGAVAASLAEQPWVLGPFACGLSHIRLWRALLAEPPDSVILVFEDESIVPADFHFKLDQALAVVPEDWDFLYLSHNRLIGSFLPSRVWLKPSSEYWGEGNNAIINAYLVRTRSLPKLLAFQRPMAHAGTADDNMRRHFMDFQAYFLIVELVAHRNRPSVCRSKLMEKGGLQDAEVPPSPMVGGLLPRPDGSPGVVDPSRLYQRAFVINRAVDVERLVTFGANAAAAGLQFEVFEAADKELLDVGRLLADGEITIEVAARMMRDPASTRGPYACTISHNRLWRRLVKEVNASAFLVFEDDSYVPVDFHAKLQQAAEHVPGDWDLLYLNHNRLVGNFTGDNFWYTPTFEYTGIGTNALLNAYLVRPAGLARILAFQHPVSFKYSNDDNIRRHFREFKAYFLVEKLVPANGYSVRITKRTVSTSSSANWPGTSSRPRPLPPGRPERTPE